MLSRRDCFVSNSGENHHCKPTFYTKTGKLHEEKGRKEAAATPGWLWLGIRTSAWHSGAADSGSGRGFCLLNVV